MNLLEILRRPEGKTLEFKRDLSSPDGLLKTVVAFANTAGGTILVGVEDKSRDVCGVAEPLSVEERLASLISDSIHPRLLPDLEILSYRATHVVAVTVFPSATRPHHLTRAGAEAGTYVRVGSTNRKADSAMIGELQRFSHGEAYDERPVPELDSEAVDFRVASESFAPVRPLLKRDLEILRLISVHQGRKVPTQGGIILFGRDRLKRFPDAWIQAGRFQGTDKTTILEQAEFKRPLPLAIDQAVTFIEAHAAGPVVISRMRRTHSRSLPPAAVREAVINAVAHADYSQRGAPIRISIFEDRLEVESPGLLPFGLTIADLPLGVSKLRNRVIGRVLHELRLVEHWGSGIQRMISACRDAQLGPPVLEEIGLRFRVTFHTERVKSTLMDPVDRAILALLKSPEGLSTHEIAAGIGRTPRSTRTRLAALVGRGLVREIGTGPQDPKRRYFLAESP